MGADAASRTEFPDLFIAFTGPFENWEVKERSQGGKKLYYVTARTVANRLDTAIGPENWWDDYVPGEHSVLCRLTILLPDGRQLTKCDAGGYAGMADQGDDDKSGFSDAFKRAAAKFGIGRYLYRDGVPEFRSSGGDDDPPVAPADESRPAVPSQPAAGNAPRSGRALFAWVKEQEQKHEVGLLKYLNGWAKLQKLPDRIVDFDHAQVALAHAEACRKLATLGSQEVPEPPSSSPDEDTPDRIEIGGESYLRPRKGSDLFRVATAAGNHHKSSIRKELMDDAKAAGESRQMAEWDGPAIDRAWRKLVEHCTRRHNPRPQQIQVFRLARTYLATIKQVAEDAIPNPDVQAEIARNYASLWQAEVIDGIEQVTEPDRLEQLIETFVEHCKEAEGVPVNI